MGTREKTYALKQNLDRWNKELDNLMKQKSQKEAELDKISKEANAYQKGVDEMSEKLKDDFNHFIDNLSRYEQTLMRRIISGDEAFGGLEKVFIREDYIGGGNEYVYRPAFTCVPGESSAHNEYCIDCDTTSYARQDDCRLGAIESAIVGDGVLVKSELTLHGHDIIRLFAFFYREAKPKKLPDVLERFKKAIEGEEWNRKTYNYTLERYLFDLYITPKTTQKTRKLFGRLE